MIPRYDHWHEALNDLAVTIRAQATRPEHEALAAKLEACAVAVHDLDAVWARGCAPGYELPAIAALLDPVDLLNGARRTARVAAVRLVAALDQMPAAETMLVHPERDA